MPDPDETPEIRLIALDGAELVEPTRAILREYADSLSVDLRFQNFEYELATLPGDYAPPLGRLLLAFVGDALAGCGALRPVPEADYANACEMKRLYVRPAFRRFGLGRALAQALLDEARVAVTPGEAFDAPGFLRISYATSLQELKRGTERLLTFVRSLESRKAVAG